MIITNFDLISHYGVTFYGHWYLKLYFRIIIRTDMKKYARNAITMKHSQGHGKSNGI